MLLIDNLMKTYWGSTMVPDSSTFAMVFTWDSIVPPKMLWWCMVLFRDFIALTPMKYEL